MIHLRVGRLRTVKVVSVLVAGIVVSSIGVDTEMAARAVAQTAGDDVPVDTASGVPVGVTAETTVDDSDSSQHTETESPELLPADEAVENVETVVEDVESSEHADAESPKMDPDDDTDSDAFAVDERRLTPTADSLETVSPPIAVDDVYVTQRDGDLEPSALTNLLRNDFQAHDVGLGIVPSDRRPNDHGFTQPRHGTLRFGNSDGTFTSIGYRPNPGFVGVDSFTYRVWPAYCNGIVDPALWADPNRCPLSNVATVTIHVVEPPIARPDTYETYQDTPLVVERPGVLANDTDPQGDPLVARIQPGPANGTLDLNISGAFTYTPSPGFVGTFTFTYVAEDLNNRTRSEPATVTIHVRPRPNRPPTIDDLTAAVDEGRSVAVTFRAADPDGQPLTFAVTSGPTAGTVSGAGPTFTYTAAIGPIGTDTFTMEVCDPVGACATGQATIEISGFEPPTEPPEADATAHVDPDEVEPDGTVTIAGSGFQPGEAVFVVQFPAGVRRVGSPADASGAVDFAFPMNSAIDPEHVRPGVHEMFLFGAERVLAGPVRVIPGPPAELVLDPSATTVDQGGAITIGVTGIDRFDNPTGDITDQVTFTSSVTTDVIAGNRVTFPTASPHLITATHPRGATADVTIEVTPATAPATTAPPAVSPPTTVSGGSATTPDNIATARATPNATRSKDTLPRTGAAIASAVIGLGAVGAGILATLGARTRRRRRPRQQEPLLP